MFASALVEAVNLFEELSLIICSPSSISKEIDWKTNSNISIVQNLKEINLKSINCVMADVFVSMNDKDSIEKNEFAQTLLCNIRFDEKN